MAKPRRGAAKPPHASRRSAEASHTYWDRSKQPLEILALVAPLVVVYEIGLVWALRAERGTITNRAHEGLLRVFDAVGIDIMLMALPAAAVLVVLVTWQFLSRRPWSLDLPTLGLMVIESAAAALPLAVFAQVVARSSAAWESMGAMSLGDAAPAALAAAGGPESLGLLGKVSLAIGAGVYEELIFRMALIALLHTLFVDAMRMSERWGIALAIAISAALFAIYHPLGADHGGIDWARATFFLGAGAYFGVIYVMRGFGIAVGAHAAYDLLAVVALPAWYA
jgi:membrane protease YdiL (CAAX protease family)